MRRPDKSCCRLTHNTFRPDPTGPARSPTKRRCQARPEQLGCESSSSQSQRWRCCVIPSRCKSLHVGIAVVGRRCSEPLPRIHAGPVVDKDTDGRLVCGCRLCHSARNSQRYEGSQQQARGREKIRRAQPAPVRKGFISSLDLQRMCGSIARGMRSPSCVQGFAVEIATNSPACSSAYVMAFSTVLRQRYGRHERFGGVLTRPKGGGATKSLAQCTGV